MREYKVKITERLVATIPVQANSAVGALEKARSMYRDSEIVLMPDDYADTAIELADAGADQSSDMKCACGSVQFAARQICYHHVVVSGASVSDVAVYKTDPPFSPFECLKCGALYDESAVAGEDSAGQNPAPCESR